LLVGILHNYSDVVFRFMNITLNPVRSFWWIALSAFALFVAVNYWPIVEGRIPFPRDLVLRHAAWDGLHPALSRSFAGIVDMTAISYPFHTLAGRAAHAGTLALWNPYILAGSPFQANSQSALFYPLNFVYYILPAPLAWAGALAVRMFLAALFMALFVRAIGGTVAGCVVSGMVFAACGFMTAWQGMAISDGATWLPMICYAVHRLHGDRSLRSVALAAVSFAVPVLAGHPETAFHVTLTGSALALAMWILPWDSGASPFDKRFIAAFALAGVLALGLASVQMFPTVEWLGQLKQQLDIPEPALSRHDAQGFFSRDILSDPNSALIPIPEAASYTGMLALLAAPFALFHRSRRQVLFFAVITVFAVAIAFSVEPVHWIIVHLPLIKAMKNGRFILVASFGIAAMAGLGTSVLEEKTPGPAAWILLAGSFVLALFGIFEVHRATQGTVPFMRGPGGSLIFLIAAMLLLALQLRGSLPGTIFSFLVCVFTAIELISFSYGYTGFAAAKEIFPPAPVFDFLARQGDPAMFRIAKVGYPIPANSGMVYGIEMAEGYDLSTERTRLFTGGLTETRDDGVFFLADKIIETRDRRLDLLNVKYIVAIARSPEFDRLVSRPERFAVVYKEGSIAVFENKSVLPRAFVVPQRGIEVIPEAPAQLSRVKDPAFDPERQVVVSRPAAEDGGGTNEPFSGGVRLSESNNNSYAFQTRTSAPSVFVLSQIYYPGWRATIDGGEAIFQPVDFGLCGVTLPAGTHEVRFAFEPESFRLGAFLSLLSIFVVAAMVTRGGKRLRTSIAVAR
jgi:hypothetical protein